MGKVRGRAGAELAGRARAPRGGGGAAASIAETGTLQHREVQ